MKKNLAISYNHILCVLLALVVTLTLATGCGGEKTPSARENVEGLLKKGIKPNEMGMVMILEYHRIDEKEAEYTRSIDNFKKDLETLYQKGYRLAKLHDLLAGNINVPAGTTPVAFSFDDSTDGQFRYIREEGKTIIDPECALGMMNDFSKKHPDFGCTAIFNYLPGLFDQPKYIKKKVDYLYQHDFEFGDHTINHPSLGRLDDEKVQEEIALPLKEIKEINPNVKVDVLCLPHGSVPKNESLMYDGSFNGFKYHMNWSLLVGSNPMYPQYHYQSPGRLLPRVQVMNYDPNDGSGHSGSEYWLEYFDKRPEVRFMSDGDAKTICAPDYMVNRLLPDKLPEGVEFLGY